MQFDQPQQEHKTAKLLSCRYSLSLLLCHTNESTISAVRSVSNSKNGIPLDSKCTHVHTQEQQNQLKTGLTSGSAFCMENVDAV
jgi:hypothetical protein